MSDDKDDLEDHIQVVREGHGANCSSIGSVIDTLFIAQVAAGALLAVVAASLASQSNETDNEKEPQKAPPPETKS